MHDFEWFEERLDIAKWNDHAAGSRDVHASCPVHGGSDSLHITERNGKALVKCFACGADYSAVVEALETGAEPEPAPKAVTITRTKGARGKPAAAADTSNAGTGGSTPPRLHQTPLDWAAARCGITRAELDALNLPIGETGDAVVFDFPTARKLRVVGDARKKVMVWEGGGKPSLWPTPIAPVPASITVTEGEFDAICLRHSGIDAYSVTGGTSTEVPQAVWEALRDAGAEEVAVSFDLDREGRKARDTTLESIRAAGLRARPVRPVGIAPLTGETDTRDVAIRLGYPVTTEDDATEDGAVPLLDVEAAENVDLLLGWLHPNEHTILFGDGGTGKGVIAAWWATELARDEMTVLIVDYEQHARHEWRPRVGAFCAEDPAILGRIFYVQPVAPIWDIAGWIRSEAQRVNADYIIVDSITYAAAGMEPEKSVTAVKYTAAANSIGYPVLSIGHVTKADADPQHPFGSVYWHNGARITIGVSRRDEAPDSDRIVKHRKANQGQHSADMAVDWSWLATGLPPGLSFGTAYQSPQHAYEELLAKNGQPPTVDELREMTGTDISDANYRTIKTRAKGVTVTRKKKAEEAPDV